MPQWLLPALFAAAVAIGVTVVIERLGGRRGGLLGSVPTTIVPACIGIYASAADLDAFQSAMFITPAGMLIDGVFLYLWRLIPGLLPPIGMYLRLGLTIVLSLVGWCVLALGFAVGTQSAQAAGLNLVLPSASLTVLLACFGIWACRKNPPAPSGTRQVSLVVLLARGVLAGAAIAIAVILAGSGGPLLAGIVAVFPAIFLTTMVSLWISQGEAVQAGAVGPLMLGATSVSVFAFVAAWSVPAVGPALGCVVAWVVATGGVTLPAWAWLARQAEAD